MRLDVIRPAVAFAAALLVSAAMTTALFASSARVVPPSQPFRLIRAGGGATQPSCPPSDQACYVISKQTPATDTWCISRSNSCTSGLYGKQRWSAEVLDCSTGSCVRTDQVKATWSPRKGNPSTETISTKQKKATNGYTYQVIFMACPVHPSSGDPGCITGYEGVAVVKS